MFRGINKWLSESNYKKERKWIDRWELQDSILDRILQRGIYVLDELSAYQGRVHMLDSKETEQEEKEANNTQRKVSRLNSLASFEQISTCRDEEEEKGEAQAPLDNVGSEVTSASHDSEGKKNKSLPDCSSHESTPKKCGKQEDWSLSLEDAGGLKSLEKRLALISQCLWHYKQRRYDAWVDKPDGPWIREYLTLRRRENKWFEMGREGCILKGGCCERDCKCCENLVKPAMDSIADHTIDARIVVSTVAVVFAIGDFLSLT